MNGSVMPGSHFHLWFPELLGTLPLHGCDILTHIAVTMLMTEGRLQLNPLWKVFVQLHFSKKPVE